MKKIKVLGILILMLALPRVNAASVNISVSTTNTVVGGSGTATLTVSGDGKHLGQIYGTFTCGGLGNENLTYVESVSPVTNKKYTISWKASSAGTYTCSVSGLQVGILEEPDKGLISLSATSKTIKVTSSNNNSSGTTADKKTYSSDNTLASLSIDGFKFSPEFKKDITEYELTVDESVEKVKINAKANDSKASVRGDGEISLSNGENNVEIKVTAENGNEKVYKIKINVIDENPIKVTIDGKEYTVIKKNNNVIDKLDGYEEKSIKIDNQDVVSYANSNNKLTLIILKDNDGKVNYYIYEDNNYILYDEVNLGGVKLLVLDMPDDKIVSGYKKYSFKYNNKEYVGYKLNKSSDYYLIYAMDLSNGEKDLYLYDSKVNSVIRYDDDISEYYSDKYNNDTRMYKIICIAMAGVILLIIVVSLIRSIAKGKKKNINYKG